MTIKGLDVSSYQEDTGIDFEKVKKAGYEFVVIKATEGAGYTNPHFSRDVYAAHEAGLVVGAYTYFHCEQNGVTQASKLHEALSGKTSVKFVVIDFEEKPATQTPAHAHESLEEFRTVLRQHGYRTVTYSYASFLEGIVPATCKFCPTDPLWLAAYQGELPKAPKPWDHVAIWQNSQTGHVPGIEGAVDLDVFEGSATDWKDFLAGKTPTAKKRPKNPSWYKRVLEYPPSELRDPGPTKEEMQFGDDVEAVQRKLGIKVDGLYGKTTESHVKGFQKTHGLTVDGKVGPATARKLEEK